MRIPTPPHMWVRIAHRRTPPHITPRVCALPTSHHMWAQQLHVIDHPTCGYGCDATRRVVGRVPPYGMVVPHRTWPYVVYVCACVCHTSHGCARGTRLSHTWAHVGTRAHTAPPLGTWAHVPTRGPALPYVATHGHTRRGVGVCVRMSHPSAGAGPHVPRVGPGGSCVPRAPGCAPRSVWWMVNDYGGLRAFRVCGCACVWAGVCSYAPVSHMAPRVGHNVGGTQKMCAQPFRQ